jgi:hypothetical protein
MRLRAVISALYGKLWLVAPRNDCCIVDGQKRSVRGINGGSGDVGGVADMAQWR